MIPWLDLRISQVLFNVNHFFVAKSLNCVGRRLIAMDLRASGHRAVYLFTSFLNPYFLFSDTQCT